MERITQLAELSVGRGCGFALIAIMTMVVGMSSHMPSAFAVGGVACLIGSLVLLLLAWRIEHANYKRTELWLMLTPAERPPGQSAKQLITAALRRAYFWFARQAALLAAGLLVCSLLLQMVR